MDEKKGITVKTDAELHARVKAYIEANGVTMADFITQGGRLPPPDASNARPADGLG